MRRKVRKGVMSSFLSRLGFDFLETRGDFRLLGKVVDATAEATDMAVVAHEQMLSDPAEGDSRSHLNEMTNQALAPIILSEFGQVLFLKVPPRQTGAQETLGAPLPMISPSLHRPGLARAALAQSIH